MRRLLWTAALFTLAVTAVGAQEKKPQDSPAAASTRKKLQTPVTVDYKDERLEDVVKDLKRQVENLSIWVDNAGGVSNNITITYKATDKPLAEVLNGMFEKNDLGYLIGQKKDNRYDGWLIIKKGKFRGDEVAGKPPTGTSGKPAAKEDKPKADDTKPKPEDSAEKLEKEAANKLKLAKRLDGDGLSDKAQERYKEIVKKYPTTQAAKEAEKLIKK